MIQEGRKKNRQMQNITLDEEIEMLRSGNWFNDVMNILPYDEYQKLGWAIGDVLDTLELFRSLHPEEKTNADKFRAMSDEKLAKFLTDWDFCSDVCSQKYCDSPLGGKCPQNCEEQALDWLRQPAEEEI